MTTTFFLIPSTGGLYFSNVEANDDFGGESYVCVASNKILGKFVQGDYRRLVIHDQIEGSILIIFSIIITESSLNNLFIWFHSINFHWYYKS